ncbi:MAG: peroxiredoxin [Pseudomonadota bacterium]
MLAIGDTAPDFTAIDQRGSELTLAALLAKGDLILYFYPADFTPVCTAEACYFRDSVAELAELDVNVVGVSPQGSDSHQRFADRYDIPFPLIDDSSRELIRAWGVDGPLGFGVRRVTFLIGQDGIIKQRAVADLLLNSHKALVASVLEAQADS